MSGTDRFVIGITGNIACGKSLVLSTLRELGALTIDADRVAHSVMEKGTPAWREIVSHFGDQIVGEDGQIDRRRLGAIVFADPVELAALEGIVYPATIASIQQMIREAGTLVVALDAIKLFEAGLDKECDEVWTVTCEPEQQLERLMQRNHFSREDALTRINAQSPQEDKVRRSQRVIDNSGSRDATIEQVRAAWNSLPRQNSSTDHSE